MPRLAFLSALAVLLVALAADSDRVLVLANHRHHTTPSASASAASANAPRAHHHHAAPRLQPKRLEELLADQRAREFGSRRQQEQIANIRQQTAQDGRRDGNNYW